MTEAILGLRPPAYLRHYRGISMTDAAVHCPLAAALGDDLDD